MTQPGWNIFNARKLVNFLIYIYSYLQMALLRRSGRTNAKSIALVGALAPIQFPQAVLTTDTASRSPVWSSRLISAITGTDINHNPGRNHFGGCVSNFDGGHHESQDVSQGSRRIGRVSSSDLRARQQTTRQDKCRCSLNESTTRLDVVCQY
jgi:hypothetical protein